MTKEERTLINDAVAAIRDLLPETEFGYCFEDDFELQNMAGDFIDALNSKNICAEVFAGVSKMVIIPEESDFVIKIPFDGQYDYECHEEDDSIECKTWYPFIHAGWKFHTSDWDYCDAEVAIYEKAATYKIEEFFLENIQVEEILGRPIYIQKKAVSINEGGNSGKEASPEAKENYCYCRPEYEYMDRDWVEAAIDYYGLDDVIKLKNFIDEYQLRDFHSGNLGYTSNGKPVIIDYAGWYD